MDRQRQRNSTWLDRTSGGTSQAGARPSLGSVPPCSWPVPDLGLPTDKVGNPGLAFPAPSYKFSPIVRNSGDSERELVMARWGMPGPLQFGGQPVTKSATSRARTGGAGFRRGAAVLSRRPASAGTKRHEAPQDPDMVRAERGPAAVRLCGPMDEVARSTRAKERAGRRRA